MINIYIGSRVFCKSCGSFGTVVALINSENPQLRYQIINEDGSSMVVTAAELSREPWLILTHEALKSEAEIYELLKLAERYKNSVDLVAELRAQEEKQAIEALRLNSEHKHLKQFIEGVDVFNLALMNIKRDLEKNFPETNFSFTVRPESQSIIVEWIDGFSDKLVCQVLGRYRDSIYDSFEQSIRYVPTPFNRLFGGIQSISTRRNFSDNMIARAIRLLSYDYPEQKFLLQATVKDYRQNDKFFAGSLSLTTEVYKILVQLNESDLIE